jgi:hypothetical protein
MGYVLVFAVVGYRSWISLFQHHGTWDPFLAAALSMWASSSVLSLLGLIDPLRMIPLVLFEIGYKAIWLIAVARPLWFANQLAGSPAEELTYAFLPVVVPIAVLPWRYVFRTYVWSGAKQHVPGGYHRAGTTRHSGRC